MSGHTAGSWKTGHSDPWSLENERSGNMSWIGVKADKKVVAIVMTTKHHDDLEYQANARLVASAPDLLEALVALEREASEFAKAIPPYGNSEPLRAVRAAICKARGEA